MLGSYLRRGMAAGLLAGLLAGLFGVTVGGLFGLAYACFRDHLLSHSEWNRSLSLAGAIFAGAFLIPFMKYPANPPTVGDPATIGERTASYLTIVALSLFVVLAAWYAARALRVRGTGAPLRHLTVGLGVVVAVGVLFLILPPAPDPGEFPSGLLWSFRLSSLGTQLVFWAGLGVVFGLFCERADHRKPLES